MLVSLTELRTCAIYGVGRRERDHSDAERSQHVKQIHELQEHFQEKERQILDLQDQVCVTRVSEYFHN